MKIQVRYNVAKVTAYEEPELAWLREKLSIEERVWRKDWRTGRMMLVDPKIVCYVDRMNRFPTGFLRSLWQLAKKTDGIRMELEADYDVSKQVKPLPAHQDGYLRPYQAEAIEAVCKYKRGIIWHPTGAGKTRCAIALTERIPVDWLFLVQQKDLLHQTADRYKERQEVQPGVIGDGVYIEPDPEANLTVATIQTLNSKRYEDPRAWDYIEQSEGIIVDECHVTPAATTMRVVMSSKNAYYRVGLSGTPLNRSDSKGMVTIGALGPIIHRAETQTLIDQGYLARPIIYMPKCIQKSALKWAKAQIKLIGESEARNELVANLTRMAPKPALCFFRHLQHGQRLFKLLRRDLRCELVNGHKVTQARRASIERLRRGEIDVILCSVVFQQGIDIPELRSLVNAGGGASVIATLQRLGRAMRVGDGNEVYVFDVFDRGQPNLQKHSLDRRKAYEDEGHTVSVVDMLSEMVLPEASA